MARNRDVPVSFRIRMDRGEGAANRALRTPLGHLRQKLEAMREDSVGLGMSLVAAIASLHGLSLSLGDNRPGLKVTVTGERLASRPCH